MKNNNLFLDMEVDSEFNILSYNLKQSFKVEEKNEYLKQYTRQWHAAICLFLVLMVRSYFAVKLIR